MDHVCTGRALSVVLCQTGTLDRLERTLVETGTLVYHFCDGSRIYYRDHRQSMAGVECVGLYRTEMAVVRTDLPSICCHLFCTVSVWDLAFRISVILGVWRGKTTISCVLERKTVEKIEPVTIELDFQRCYNGKGKFTQRRKTCG